MCEKELKLEGDNSQEFVKSIFHLFISTSFKFQYLDNSDIRYEELNSAGGCNG